MGEGRRVRALAWILLFQLIVQFLFVFFRHVDGDEGFYLAASQRVGDGMTLYSDFFYPQMPLLPLVFSSLSNWGMASLILLRIIASFSGLFLTYLIYRIVARHVGDYRAAILAAFLVATSGIFFAWHTTFKPYPFVDLALLASFAFLLEAGEEKASVGRNLFLAMLLLSVAVNFRSIFLVLVPLYFYFALRTRQGGDLSGWRMIGLSLPALLVPSIPAIYLWLRAPNNFWFDNLIFHFHRQPIEPLGALIQHKITTLGRFLILPQTVLLMGSIAVSLFLLRKDLVANQRLYRWSFIMAITVGLVYLLPTPIHLQYFQQTVPYLVLAALPALIYFRERPSLRRMLPSAAVLYVLGILPFVYLFILYSDHSERRFEWGHLKGVVQQIREHSGENDTLLSEWAGYAALSNRPQLPGSEHVGFFFPLKVENEVYAQNHLLTNEDIVTALLNKRPALVVVDFQTYPEWQAALQCNYHLAFNTTETFIYERNHDNL